MRQFKIKKCGNETYKNVANIFFQVEIKRGHMIWPLRAILGEAGTPYFGIFKNKSSLSGVVY